MKGFRIGKEQHIINQLKSNTQILHVGCTHAPNTVDRWNSQVLLHKQLCDQARMIDSQVVGIDIDDEALQFLQKKMPDEVILKVDAHHLSAHFGPDRKFDLIIAGDVIEHLPNPGLFLQSCNDALAPGGQLLITTINAFNITRFVKAFMSHEAVHSEHTAYYSYKTIDRLLAMSNLNISDFGYYKCEPLSVEYSLNRVISNLIENVVCLPFPQFSEGIIVAAHKPVET